jgi:hypothetical protein
MKLQDIFANDVTRNIPPVVYFHEQDPKKLAEEVSEYIITGGYGTDHQHNKATGIHEQFVRLLNGIAEGLKKTGGPELPASWISGFYGSGKSSFAKLLGLALDGVELPNGISLAKSLLDRDDSPQKMEFQKSWDAVRTQIDPIAVVFDIGASARDDEQIHCVVKRELQKRLGYCDNSYVADYELKLELDGEWERFLGSVMRLFGKPWELVKQEKMSEDKFSAVLHDLFPDLFPEKMTWIDSRVGTQTGVGSSVDETTKAIAETLTSRKPNKTLFVVIDEVSQYIFQNTNRMLTLQSFVSSLGQRLKGKVWLLATGQQQLEDNSDGSDIGKLKDRFPPQLRVHLAPTNIKDVVHKRLLKKLPAQEPSLRQLFQQHRSELKLYGYCCESLTEDDFVEIYPLLPGYVDLLMQISSNLRTRSSRAKGDDYAIRGLMQLLGEVFREQKLGEKDLGELIAIDQIFTVQRSALDNDVQTTLARIFNHDEVKDDACKIRVAQAVALLELIQEQEPTTVTLVSQCLYSRLDEGNQKPKIEAALIRLRELGLLSYSEKTGYKIQSSAGQEWDRERDNYQVPLGEMSNLIAEKLTELMGTVSPPRYKGNGFRWAAYYNDGEQQRDRTLTNIRDLDVVTVDFRYLKDKDDRKATIWIQESDRGILTQRLIWVVGGERSELESSLKALVRSKHIRDKYSSRDSSLSETKRYLLGNERSRCDDLEVDVKEAITSQFLVGELYFQGRSLDKPTLGNGFSTLLERAGESVLPTLYSQFVSMRIDPAELKQLLDREISGPSSKLMEKGLGILEADAGRYVASCKGEVPERISRYIIEQQGVAGSTLLNHFGGPPYGYSADIVRACVAGLLRGKRLRIRPETGPELTSVQDQGAQDMFTKDRDLKRAEILPPSETGITARDRIQLCKLFEDHFQLHLERDDDAIADAVFNYFPQKAQQIRDLEAKFNRLPQRPPLPELIEKFRDALTKSVGSRQVELTLQVMKRQLDILNEGLQRLNRIQRELTEDKIQSVERAMRLQMDQVKQLEEIESIQNIQDAIQRIAEQLNQTEPWREIEEKQADLSVIEQHYQAMRLSLIEGQEQQAERIQVGLRQRQGFSTLAEQKADYVVSPIRQALDDTTPTAIAPSLLQLRDSAQIRLQKAAEQANLYLDEVLSTVTAAEVVLFALELQGQEVSSPAEVEILVNRLRERLLKQLEGKENVRIRMT